MLNDRLTGEHRFRNYGIFPNFLMTDFAFLSPGAKLLYVLLINDCIEDSLGYMYSQRTKKEYREKMGVTQLEKFITELVMHNLLETENKAGSKEMMYYPLVPKEKKKAREKIICT